jgi:glutamyl-tRNA synthetase
MEKIRVRLAPSPTGPLHIGTARTALFNFLFASQNKGDFILRFEDTDTVRSTKEFEKKIIEDLKWLGLNWNEGPFYQIDKIDEYKKFADELVEKGFAAEIDGAIIFQARKTLDALQIKYEVTTRTFENEKVETLKKDSNSYLVKNIAKDLIHGEISGLVSDTVLMRSDGIPTFHLAVIVDDEKMKITHVIRGDDHLPNTPLHAVLQKALGFSAPIYAHIPLILNPDRTKMSKRHAAVDISEYRAQGYLPEALISFLALLGWAPKDNKQIFGIENLIKEFDISRVQKSAAIFDIEKLKSLNAEYIRKMPVDQLDEILKKDFYPKNSVGTLELTKALQTRIVLLSDVKEMSKFFFEEPKIIQDVLIFKKSNIVNTKNGLKESFEVLKNAGDDDWSSVDELNKILANVVEKSGLSNGDVFWPVRAALSGSMQSPSPTELLTILGKEKSISRIQKAIEVL